MLQIFDFFSTVSFQLFDFSPLCLFKWCHIRFATMFSQRQQQMFPTPRFVPKGFAHQHSHININLTSTLWNRISPFSQCPEKSFSLVSTLTSLTGEGGKSWAREQLLKPRKWVNLNFNSFLLFLSSAHWQSTKHHRHYDAVQEKRCRGRIGEWAQVLQ